MQKSIMVNTLTIDPLVCGDPLTSSKENRLVTLINNTWLSG